MYLSCILLSEKTGAQYTILSLTQNQTILPFYLESITCSALFPSFLRFCIVIHNFQLFNSQMQFEEKLLCLELLCPLNSFKKNHHIQILLPLLALSHIYSQSINFNIFVFYIAILLHFFFLLILLPLFN